MSFHDKKKTMALTLGALTLGVTLCMTTDAAHAQSFFGGEPNFRYRGPSAFALAFMRGLIMAVSFGLGFAIGWILSPEAKQFRKIALMGIGGLAVLVALLSNSALGWSLTSMLSALLFFIGVGYWLGRFAKVLGEVPTTYGSASYATYEELAERRVFEEGGIRLGAFHNGTAMETIFYNGDRHGLLVAPARTHKGTSQIVTNLLTYEGSVLNTDPKGENALMTAKARQEMGQTICKIDPWGIAPIEGIPAARLNPLDWIIESGSEMSENAMILADSLVPKSASKDPFWDMMSAGFLQGELLYVATDPHEDGQRHMGRVRDLTMLDGEDLVELFKRMLDSPHHVVAATGARMLQMDEKLRANVMASVQSHTQFLDSPSIRESMSVSDFRFEDLKSTLMTVYICAPADRLETFSRWLRILIQQAITVNARNITEKPDKPILFILDEMAALGRLSMVEQAYGLMAGYGMLLYGVVQDLSQLKRIYGDGYETFIGNSGLIQYFGSRDRLTAEYFSALCGETTVWNFSSAVSRTFSSGSGNASQSFGDTDTTAAAQRKLAYPDELMRMPQDLQLVFIENMNPIIARKVKWFEDEELKHKGVSLQ